MTCHEGEDHNSPGRIPIMGRGFYPRELAVAISHIFIQRLVERGDVEEGFTPWPAYPARVPSGRSIA